jgi:ferric-dicitrate binding protein FerR (iron transport regulator)
VSDTPYATAAAKLLSDVRAETVNPPAPDVREAAIAALATAMRRGKMRRRTQALWLAAAAAALVAGFSAWRYAPGPATMAMVTTQVGPGARVVRNGSLFELREGRAANVGDRMEAGPAGAIVLQLSTGTSLEVEPAGSIEVVGPDPGQRFSLVRGAVRADVAKIRPGQRFVIATPDIEVEVRGTAFRLSAGGAEASCEGRVRSRLEVFEGVVAVRRGDTVKLVAGGGVWPDCPAAVETAVRPPGSAAPAPAPPARAHRTEKAPPVAPATTLVDPGSTLAEENDLYGRALMARRRGDRQTALDTFLELERRFPSSHLSESAMVARMRLIAGQDRTAAGAVAREYLARFPNGFARVEAAGLAAEPPAR